MLIDGHSVDDIINVVSQLYLSICIVEQIGIGKGGALQIGFEAHRDVTPRIAIWTRISSWPLMYKLVTVAEV